MNRQENIQFGISRADWLPNVDLLFGLILSTFAINLLALAFPIALLQVYDRIVPNNAVDTLYLLALGVSSAILLETVLRVCRAWVSAWCDARYEHLMSCKMFRRILDAKFGHFEEEGSGTQLDRLSSLNTLKDFYGGQLITTLLDVPFVFLYLGLMYYLGGKIVIVTAISLLILLIYTYSNGRKLKDNLLDQSKADDRRMNFIIEVLNGIHTVKSMGLEAQMLRRYERLQESSAKIGHNMAIINGGAARMGAFLSQISIILVVVYGSILIINGEITLGTLAACTLLAGRTIQPLSRAAALWSRLQSVYVTKDKLQALMAIPIETTRHLPLFGSAKGDIEIKKLSYRLKEDGAFVLKNINLEIPFGKTVALEGAGNRNGRGTLLNIIGGLLQPTEGELIVNGKNVYQHNIQDYRNNIGYLPEEGVLFEGTILDNITMFKEGKYYEQALEISDFVGLSSVIEHMQEGYLTKVGQGTVEAVPKGIKQRIAIARALIHHPPIILFDEANSALDIQADEKLIKSLRQLKGQCTLILISHRPSTTRMADFSYCLNNGVLMENKR